MSKAPELEGHVYYKPWSTGGNIHNLGSREGGVEGAQVTPTLESWEDWGTFEPCHSRKFIGYYTLNLPFQPVLTTSMTKKHVWVTRNPSYLTDSWKPQASILSWGGVDPNHTNYCILYLMLITSPNGWGLLRRFMGETPKTPLQNFWRTWLSSSISGHGKYSRCFHTAPWWHHEVDCFLQDSLSWSWSRRFPIGTNKQEIHESTKKTYGTAQKK